MLDFSTRPNTSCSVTVLPYVGLQPRSLDEVKLRNVADLHAGVPINVINKLSTLYIAALGYKGHIRDKGHV